MNYKTVIVAAEAREHFFNKTPARYGILIGSARAAACLDNGDWLYVLPVGDAQEMIAAGAMVWGIPNGMVRYESTPENVTPAPAAANDAAEKFSARVEEAIGHLRRQGVDSVADELHEARREFDEAT